TASSGASTKCDSMRSQAAAYLSIASGASGLNDGRGARCDRPPSATNITITTSAARPTITNVVMSISHHLHKVNAKRPLNPLAGLRSSSDIAVERVAARRIALLVTDREPVLPLG